MKDGQFSGKDENSSQQRTPHDEEDHQTSDPNKSKTQRPTSKGEAKLILPPKGWRFVPMSQVEHLLTARQRRLRRERKEKKANREKKDPNSKPPLIGYLNQDAPNPQLPETGSSDSEA